MPNYIVTVRGGVLDKGGLKPTGSIVSLSEADAASLPPGTVELAPEQPAVIAPVTSPAESTPEAPPTPEAPKGRKAK